MKKIVKIEEVVEPDDFVLYSDTDSAFVESLPMIKHMMPNVDFNNDDEMTKAIMSVTTEIQDYVNKFYNIMAKRFFNLDKHTFDAKQEVISKSSFWLAKKRYAQWIIHKEGHLLKTPELEVKGIDIVRSSFPPAFRKFMDSFVRKLLTNSLKLELDTMILEFKEKVKSLDIIEIAKITSVKFVSQDGVHNYNPDDRRPFQFVKGTPAQVKACLAYNDMIIKLGLEKTCEQIHHGQKIKYVYLKNNSYGVEAMALKGDGNDDDIIIDFVNEHIDRNKMFERELESKLVDFYTVFNWELPSKSAKLAESFFDFS